MQGWKYTGVRVRGGTDFCIIFRKIYNKNNLRPDVGGQRYPCPVLVSFRLDSVRCPDSVRNFVKMLSHACLSRFFAFQSYFKVCALNPKRSATDIVHDIDYDEAYYIDNIQKNYPQGESTNSPLIDTSSSWDLSPFGKNPFGKIELNTFREAMEKIMENDEQLWKSLFQHHLN